MATVRIALVDDHSIFRKGVILSMRNNPSIVPVIEAGNGQEFIEALEQKPGSIDLVLLDLKMPVMNGFDTLKVLKKKYPGLKIIIFTMFEDVKLINHSLLLGADAYLSKSAEPQEIQKAIHQVMNTGQYRNKIMRQFQRTKKTIDPTYNPELDHYTPITGREQEIIDRIKKCFLD